MAKRSDPKRSNTSRARTLHNRATRAYKQGAIRTTASGRAR